jgi:hypothetical protein
LIQDYLEAARRRADERPGWAGVPPMPARDRSSTVGTTSHWPSPQDTGRDDVPEEQPA